MKIEIPGRNNQDYFARRLLQLLKKRSFFLLASFLTYNLLLAAIVLTLFYSEVPYSRRQTIRKTLVSYAKGYLSKASFKEKDIAANIAHIDIHIEPRHLSYLSPGSAALDRRKRSSGSAGKGVPATIRHEGTVYEAILSISDPLSMTEEVTENGWSFKVSLEDGQTLLGMKRFSLHPLPPQGRLDEWLTQQLLAYMGLSSLRYDYLTAAVNEEAKQVYVLKEDLEHKYGSSAQAEGPVVRFRRTGQQGINPDLLAPADPTLNSIDALRSTANSMLEKFRRQELTTSEVFDVKKLAVCFAVMDLLGDHHPVDMDHIRFYYNPASARLEPVISGRVYPEFLENTGLLGAERQLRAPVSEERWWTQAGWCEATFEDPAFYGAYIGALENIATGDFLNAFLEQHEARYLELQAMLHREQPGRKTDPFSILYHNQEYLYKALRPAKQLHIYYNREKTSEHELHLDIGNIHFLPVEVISAVIGDSIDLELIRPAAVIEANVLQTSVSVQPFRFAVPEELNWVDTLLPGLLVRYKMPGSNRILKDRVVPYRATDESLRADDLMRRQSNIREFSFLKVQEQHKTVQIKKGIHQLDRDLIMPKGYSLIAEEGAQLDMINKATILCYAPLRFTGSKASPVRFFSSDSTAQGITVLNAGKPSLLRHVQFDNLSNPDRHGWSLTSAVTFYASPVTLEHCLFSNNRTGDDYLNIVLTDFTISQTVFLNTYADAFDGDYSNGLIKSSRFINSGNDAIDISGSHITVENIVIDQTGDKGLSAGENSTIEGRKLWIKNAEIAVTAKDLSTIRIDDIEIEDSRIAYTAFQKKPEFGAAAITVGSRSVIRGKVEIPYLIESSSSLTIAGEPVSSSIGIDHVKQILYGVKYGKSSR